MYNSSGYYTGRSIVLYYNNLSFYSDLVARKLFLKGQSQLPSNNGENCKYQDYYYCDIW